MSSVNPKINLTSKRSKVRATTFEAFPQEKVHLSSLLPLDSVKSEILRSTRTVKSVTFDLNPLTISGHSDRRK